MIGLDWLLGLLGAFIGAVWLAYTRDNGVGRQSEEDRAACASNQLDRRMDDAGIGIGASADDNRERMGQRGNKWWVLAAGPAGHSPSGGACRGRWPSELGDEPRVDRHR